MGFSKAVLRGKFRVIQTLRKISNKHPNLLPKRIRKKKNKQNPKSAERRK